MKCKITNKKINPFMTFGRMPSANGFLEKKDFKNEFFYKMEVGFSEEVCLFQLNEFSNPKQLFSSIAALAKTFLTRLKPLLCTPLLDTPII